MYQELSSIERLLSDIESFGVKMNVVLATAVINALRNVRRNDDAAVAACKQRADEMMSLVRQMGTINATTYTCALALHAEVCDVAGMNRLWSQMELDGVRPTPTMYKTLSRACVDGGMLEHADRFSRQHSQWEMSEQRRNSAR